MSAIAIAGLVVAGYSAANPAQAAPSVDGNRGSQGKAQNDNLRTDKQVKQDALRQKALEKRVRGDPAAQGKVAKLGKGQYVNLENEGTDKIFVVLVEFGDTQYPDRRFQGPPPDGSTTDVTGPLHNQIPAPDRANDNTTLWQADYNRTHYEDMYFNRMARYYETQSSGRYSVDGAVTEWVKVPFNEALYGRNYCGSIVCSTSKALVRDALAVWVDAQLKSGKSMAEVQAYLKTFDQQDRTTSTATATSTSRTVSSTTSRSSTRAATRRPATRTRAPTRSGVTAPPRTCSSAVRWASASTSAPTPAW